MQYLHFYVIPGKTSTFQAAGGAAALKATLYILSGPSGRTASF